MSRLRSIVYVSASRHLLGVAELEALAARWRSTNRDEGITGVLLYADGNFIHLLEGEEARVEALYQRIRADPLHGQLIELSNRAVAQRSFAECHLGLARAPRSPLLAQATARWDAIQADARAGEAGAEALTLLRRFWALNTQLL